MCVPPCSVGDDRSNRSTTSRMNGYPRYKVIRTVTHIHVVDLVQQSKNRETHRYGNLGFRPLLAGADMEASMVMELTW